MNTWIILMIVGIGPFALLLHTPPMRRVTRWFVRTVTKSHHRPTRLWKRVLTVIGMYGCVVGCTIICYGITILWSSPYGMIEGPYYILLGIGAGVAGGLLLHCDSIT